VVDFITVFMDSINNSAMANVLSVLGFLTIGFFIGKIIREEKK